MSIKNTNSNQVKRTTLVDIARAAGVSSVLVGKAIHGSGSDRVKVSHETALRIRKVAMDMGYRPNIAARQLKSGMSQTIGVLIDSHAPVVVSDIVAGIEKYCMQKGYRLIFGQAHNDLNIFREYVNDFISRGVDGLICASHDYEQADVIPNLLKDMPHVLFLGSPKTDTPCSYIEVDLADGVSQAVKHLANTGRRNIGLIQFNSASRATQQRFDGYINALKELGIDFSPNHIEVIGVKDTNQITTDEVSLIVSNLFYGQHLHGIICANDIIAAHAVQACKRMGIRVPQDVSVIGCDNSDFSVVIDPPLTTIDQNIDQLAKQAVAILFDKMGKGNSEPKAKNQTLIKPGLIIRESA